MKKQMPFLVNLLTATLVATLPAAIATTAQAAPPAQTPTLPTTTQPTTSAPALKLEDLPTGFEEIPPEVRTQISTRLEPFKQILAKGNLSLDNFFAFVEPTKFQVVFGFTGNLPSRPSQAIFDTTLQQVQQPEVLEQTFGRIRQALQPVKEIQLVEYKALPDLNNIANASTGLTIAAQLQGVPLRVDVAGFRRNTFGAFTGVLYLDKSQPLIAVKDVAGKLDNRILQTPSAMRSR